MISQKLKKIESRYKELENLLADTNAMANQEEYQKLAKEYADITEIAQKIICFSDIKKQINDLKSILTESHDKEFTEMANEELGILKQKEESYEAELEDMLNPKKQASTRNIIFEIRAGTGGEEASLFAADLYRMYTRYAANKGWKVDPISMHESETGGFKEVIFSISGTGAEDRLKFESGGHRVQRVPVTEASGRIHTSAATVCVLTEPEEVEIDIDPKDLKIDVFRSSGPGGQSVNTTDSAVRITHLPTGMVVVCQDERSQLKNKHKAMRVLRARLDDQRRQEQFDKESKDRKLKVGSGDRSEKIRTYNFPERRVTDHRIGITLHKLDFIMNGELDELTDALMKTHEEETK
jgi:peptide chain release factor 1